MTNRLARSIQSLQLSLLLLVEGTVISICPTILLWLVALKQATIHISLFQSEVTHPVSIWSCSSYLFFKYGQDLENPVEH